MRPIIAVEELRSIGDLPPPPLATTEIVHPRWHPKHARAEVQAGAQEKPLKPAEMARQSDQTYALVQITESNAEPAVHAVMTAHISCDDAAGDFPVIVVRP